ncbi:MAG: hypothetical protein HRU38_15905 [Saccharospirillaceae bacterium]|nr:hypothetical protein [Pseudomonadales bacterium]NRB80126.1 hypothetical protein [Saccharospirillaceae bacterium]
MKLLKYLSVISLSMLTVSFSHAFDNDWGQWQDDSFYIDIIESFDDGLQNSIDVHSQKNKKNKKNKKNNTRNKQTTTKNDFNETLDRLEVPENSQDYANNQYIEPNISDYENKDNLTQNDDYLFNLPPEVEFSDLDNDIEVLDYEYVDFNSDYENKKFIDGAEEPPEFDYQDYEYKIEEPTGQEVNSTPETSL